jgi:hypothetical protein
MDGKSLVGLLRGEQQSTRLAFAETDIWFADPVPGLTADSRISYPSVAHVTEIDLEHNAEIVLRQEFAAKVVEAKHRMVRDSRYKLIYVPTDAEVRWLLYDTLADPEETQDVTSICPDVAEQLKVRLWDWMLSDPAVVRVGDRLIPRSDCFPAAVRSSMSVSLTEN